MPKTPLLQRHPPSGERELDRAPQATSAALAELIWVDANRVSGAPCFAGTRVPVKHLWDYLESGEPLEEFLEGFPGVTREQAIGVLEIAFHRLLS